MTIQVPTYPLQKAAIEEAASKRGMPVGDYVLDCVMTYATTHLSRGLKEWVDLERQVVSEGTYQVCGKTAKRQVLVEGQSQWVDSDPCCRILNHEQQAVAGRDAHCLLRPDGQYEVWAD